jgi:phenylalanyl-tRNA synthetase beta chain
MRFSLDWLKAWVKIELSPEDLCSALTLSGLEVDAMTINKPDNDIYIDIDFTPNRGDCLSVQGLAREISAKTSGLFHSVYDFKHLAEQDSAKVNPNLNFPVNIHPSAQELCPLYLGRVIQDINPKSQTPDWLKIKLEKAEIKTIHPVVDILNYVMIELGQPMHAFDLSKIQAEIQVRLAQDQEKIKLLDGKEIELKNHTLVIADKNTPIAIAGIMGGLESGVADNTTQIFLESAWFTPEAIAGKARQYGLHTDASYRFERGVDYALPHQAMILATNLIMSICGGKIGEIITLKTPALPTQAKQISLRPKRVAQILGVELDSEMIKKILTRLGCLCDSEKDKDFWQVTVPSYRYDLNIEVDLIEEIARIYGYENIPAQSSVTTQILDNIELGLTLRRVKHQLVALGYREVITYSFVPPKLDALVNPGVQGLTLVNPISQEMSMMRTSLMPGLIQTLQFNLARQVTSLAIFETGLCFYYRENELIQQNRIAGLIYGKRHEENWATPKQSVDFFDIKAHVESLIRLKQGGLHDYTWERFSHPSFHPGQSAEIRHKGKVIAWAGALAPSLLAKLDIPEPVYYFRIMVPELLKMPQVTYNKFSAFPSTRRDLAFILPEEIPAKTILSEIEKQNKAFIQESFIFDVYRGKNIEAGKKSLAVGIIFQHPTRTLIEAEVEEVILTIIENLKNKYGITLRD